MAGGKLPGAVIVMLWPCSIPSHAVAAVLFLKGHHSDLSRPCVRGRGPSKLFWPFLCSVQSLMRACDIGDDALPPPPDPQIARLAAYKLSCVSMCLCVHLTRHGQGEASIGR